MNKSALSIATVCLIVIALLSAPAWSQRWPASKLAPNVPSPKDAGERMLQMAKVTKSDVVYDLGAGDGRLVVLAAERFGANAVGVEIDEELCSTAQQQIARQKVQKKAKMVCADLMTVDLSDASVVTIYLTTVGNSILRPHLEKALKPGTRVVSYAFEIPGWKAVRTENFTLPGDRSTIKIYLYTR